MPVDPGAGATPFMAARLAAARRLIGLHHRNLTQVLRVDNEFRTIAMEWLEGAMLPELMARGGLSFEACLRILMQVLDGLSALHRAGLVHGDVSPGNVRVLSDGTVKLIDFDLTGVDVPRGYIVFTPAYAAPERVQELEIDARTDIYGAGVLAYTLVNGRPPFTADHLPELVKRIVDGRLPPLAGEWASACPMIGAIVNRAMARRPDDRYQSAMAMRDAIADLLEDMRGQFSGLTPMPPNASVHGAKPGHDTLLRDRIGSYELLEHVSTGAMGDVYRAREVDSQRMIALKVVRPAIQAPTSRESTGAIPAAASMVVPRPRKISPPQPFDEDVQFTVYRPETMPPDQWQSMLAFAHLSKRAADAKPTDPDPVAEVRRQAQQVLGDAVSTFKATTQDSGHAVPRHGQLTFVPRGDGLEFNPASRQFLWTESVHREEFRVRAAPEVDNQTVRGALSVYLGSVLLAEVNFAIRVDSQARAATATAATARPYRRIFASYSHRDAGVVQEFESLAGAMGDRYLRDALTLRSGEMWSDRLRELIDHADVFQLFWSRHAMVSPFVRSEWEYALALNRPNFVRPVYWEDPFPESPGLPPDDLRTLHFARVSVSGVRPLSAERASTVLRSPEPEETLTLPARAARPAPLEASQVAAGAPKSSSPLRLIFGLALALIVLSGLVFVACPPR